MANGQKFEGKMPAFKGGDGRGKRVLQGLGPLIGSPMEERVRTRISPVEDQNRKTRPGRETVWSFPTFWIKN